ncbi:hypothetical protein JCM3765_005878 [Sporobolomyces pararoseus]
MPLAGLSRRRNRPFARFALLLISLSLFLVSTQPRWQSWTIAPELANAQSVLWITAHPDDESFFFAPTITNLVRSSTHTQASLLCLSVGDYEGTGLIRRSELHESCKVLGIDESRCLAIDHPQLPDNPNVNWPAEVVLNIVKQRATDWKSNAIITFDDYGVSGHANHRILHKILSDAIRNEALSIPVYSLCSANILAKYTSLALLPFAFVKHIVSGIVSPSKGSSSLFASSFKSFALARASFAAHKSQSRWFRTLFVSASRYLWYVQLDRVE